MRIPVITGVIDRRILTNFRIEPEVLARVLPAPFRPKLVNGQAIGGICMIRLVELRPRGAPAVVGVGSENAAHRFAVEWDQDGEVRQGVYIPRRDTDSRLVSALGGRLFPGVHHHARFDIEEGNDRYSVTMVSDDDATRVHVAGRRVDTLPERSVFSDLAEASRFFEEGSLGYSDTQRPGTYDGLELRTDAWQVAPLAVESVESSYFADTTRFPPGSTALDCALLMRRIPHEWHGRASLRA